MNSMNFRPFNFKITLPDISKLERKDSIIVFLLNGMALAASIINEKLIEKTLPQITLMFGMIALYLTSSFLIYKGKNHSKRTLLMLFRCLFLSTFIITIGLDFKVFHFFHIFFLFFLTFSIEEVKERFLYPILLFFIFIIKIEIPLAVKFIISFFLLLSSAILIILLKNRKSNEDLATSQDSPKLNKETLIINEATKLAALTEMSNGVTHEINNPLTIIAGVTQIMDMKLENNNLKNDDLKGLIDTIQKATERASHVVRRLEEFSRDGSKDPFRITSIQTLCLDSIDIFNERFHKLDIKVKTDQLKSFSINCKAIQIVQVLFHLINNSLFEILKLDKKWIEFSSKEDNSFIYLRITDSGHGIPIQVVKNMFEPFFSGKDENKEGTGLGLSIAKIILTEHRGNISYDLFKGHTSFLLKFPKISNESS